MLLVSSSLLASLLEAPPGLQCGSMPPPGPVGQNARVTPKSTTSSSSGDSINSVDTKIPLELYVVVAFYFFEMQVTAVAYLVWDTFGEGFAGMHLGLLSLV